MTMREPEMKSQWTFKGWHMALIMVSFFGVIISVNIMMATLANKTWTGLIVKNSYVASQEYNAKIAEKRAQDELGWRSSAVYENGVLTIDLLNKDLSPVTVQSLIAKVGRPVFEQDDHLVTLKHQGNGRYRARNAMGEGMWDVHFMAQNNGETLYQRQVRFMVDRSETGRLQ